MSEYTDAIHRLLSIVSRCATDDIAAAEADDELNKLLFVDLATDYFVGDDRREVADACQRLHSAAQYGGKLAPPATTAFNSMLDAGLLQQAFSVDSAKASLHPNTQPEVWNQKEVHKLASLPWSDLAESLTEEKATKVRAYASFLDDVLHELDDGFVVEHTVLGEIASENTKLLALLSSE